MTQDNINPQTQGHDDDGGHTQDASSAEHNPYSNPGGYPDLQGGATTQTVGGRDKNAVPDDEYDEFEEPIYGATLAQSWGRLFRGVFSYGGQSSRSEFWWVTGTLFVIQVIVFSILSYYSTIPSSGPNFDIAVLSAWGVTFLASIILALFLIPLNIRRLRNAGFHWSLFFLRIIPGIGKMIIYILCAIPAAEHRGRYQQYQRETTDNKAVLIPPRD